MAPVLAHAQHSPYGGEERREIKALSADEVDQYLAGAGMGYARAAELNRFPGPMHVLDLGDQLALSAEQRESAQRLMERHKAAPVASGNPSADEGNAHARTGGPIRSAAWLCVGRAGYWGRPSGTWTLSVRAKG